MAGKTPLHTPHDPIGEMRLAATARRSLGCHGRAPFLAFAFFYFFAASDLLRVLDGDAGVGSTAILDVLSYAAVQALPFFALALAIDLERQRPFAGRAGGGCWLCSCLRTPPSARSIF